MERGIAKGDQWLQITTERIYELALLGATDEKMAKILGVSMNTFSQWKVDYPYLYERLQEGRVIADSKVAAALYKKAVGFTYEEERAFLYKGHIIKETVKKYCIPDTAAQAKWLAIRQAEYWREVSKTESVQTNINITKLDLSGFSTEELRVIRRLQIEQAVKNVSGN